MNRNNIYTRRHEDDGNVKLVRKIWLPLFFGLILVVQWAMISQQYAKGQNKDKEQDEALEAIRDQQRELNTVIAKNTSSTESLGKKVESLESKIAESVKSTDKLIKILLARPQLP